MKNSEKPAFPISEEETDRIDKNVSIYTGLTKREHTAIKIAAAICVNAGRNSHNFVRPDLIAKEAIVITDELLRQLES